MKINFYELFHKSTKEQGKLIARNNFTYRILIETIETVISKNVNKVLDYGCGAGTLSLYLGRNGVEILGVDVSKHAIKSATKSSKLLNLQNVKFKKIIPMEVPNYKPDLIICTEVIEHIQEDSEMLTKLSKILKPGGILLLSTPSSNAPLYKIGLTKNFDKRVGHLRRYNAENLKKLIEESGLRIISLNKTEGVIRNSLYVFPVAGWIIKFLKGPFSDFFTFIDNISLLIFGESDLIIIGRKK